MRRSVFDHYCPEWDYLRIMETDEEFLACTCCFGSIYDELKAAAKERLEAAANSKVVSQVLPR